MSRYVAFCLSLLAIAAPVATADTGVIEQEGSELEPPEHAMISLSSTSVVFEGPPGTFICDGAVGEATFDEPHIDGPTEVGDIDELDFSYQGLPDCLIDSFFYRSCDPNIELPMHATLVPDSTPPVLSFGTQELNLECITVLGPIDCHYEFTPLALEWTAGTGVLRLDASAPESGSSMLCWTSLSVEAEFELSTEDGDEITYESL